MGKLPPEIYTDRDIASGSSSQQHENNLHNIRGTFAAEGMTISKSTRINLDRTAGKIRNKMVESRFPNMTSIPQNNIDRRAISPGGLIQLAQLVPFGKNRYCQELCAKMFADSR